MKLVADEQPLTGDMAIKDLTPQTTNIGHRIVKNMRICGSGIYTYHKSEAPLLGFPSYAGIPCARLGQGCRAVPDLPGPFLQRRSVQ